MQSWSWFSLKSFWWLPFLFRIKSKLISMGYTFPVWALPYLSALFQPRSMLQPHWDTCSMIPMLAKYLLLLLTPAIWAISTHSPTVPPVRQTCFFHLRANTLSYSLRNLFLNCLPSKPGAFSTLPCNCTQPFQSIHQIWCSRLFTCLVLLLCRVKMRSPLLVYPK